jgi:hypothetical protein
MYFLVDDKNKVVFGWSTKCGCSHIKTIFYFLTGQDKIIHTIDDMMELPENIENYNTIIFCRNPYERIVSGFLEKYKKNGQLRIIWKHKDINFTLFVDELIKNDWKMVEHHHFTQQTSEKFEFRILKSKTIKFFDIKNINYQYIENLFDKKISDNILNKRYGHERKIYDNTINNYIYDLNIDEYFESNVDLKYFYNNNIKNKIFNFYKQDFEFFYENGIDYINNHTI